MERTIETVNGILCIRDDGIVVQIADRVEDISYKDIKSVNFGNGNLDISLYGKKGMRLKYREIDTENIRSEYEHIRSFVSSAKRPHVVSKAIKAVKTHKLAASILILSVMAAASAITLLSVSSDNRRKYIDNLNYVVETMLTGGAEAEALCGLAHDVWRDTIYEEYNEETIKYTSHAGMGRIFNEDFNDSIQSLYADTEIIIDVATIEAYQEIAEDLMKRLSNPIGELEICYTTLTDLYASFTELTGLAVSPTGSLTSYTDDVNNCESDFVKYYERILTQIPEK